MTWEKCPNWNEISKEQLAIMRDTRRLKLYADEDVDQNLIEDLRYNRVNIRSARELGHQGKPDTFHAALAHRQHRCLLTKDRDYFNNRLFPFNRLSGVIVVKDHEGKDDVYLHILDNLVTHLIPYGDFVVQMKIELSDTIINMCYVDHEGFMEERKHQLINGFWHQFKRDK